MKVSIILMQFPTPRETFASNDINSLHNQLTDLNIYCLRSKHKQMNSLISERGHSDLDINHNSLLRMLFAPFMILTHPVYLIKLLIFIVKHCYKKPEHLFKSLILAPRAIEIFLNIKTIKPDLVHLYWSHYPSMVGYLIKKYLPNIKVTITFIAYDLAMRYGLSIEFAKKADAVFTIANIDIPIIKGFGVPEHKIKAVYHGVNPKYLSLLPKEKISNRIITAGALIKDKKIDDVIETFEKIKQIIPDSSLVILGDGPQRTFLENLVSEKHLEDVFFKGHVSHDQVIEEMLYSEIFLFISQHNERLPNVVKEAIASYCYCVVSDTTGIEELIEDKISGSVILKGDVEAAYKEVVAVLNHKERLYNSTQLAHNHLSKHFNVDNCMQSYIDKWNK